MPDLAVIATPPAAVPDVIGALGTCGTRAAVVLTAGLAAARDGEGRSLTQAMLEAAHPHLLRILGPNCVGLLVPGLGINASFAHTSALPGNLAFVSQSGGLTTAVLDWARSRGIGFSHFVSLGDAADVDFGDLLDYLGSDPATHAILLYIESVRAARKFMSAARAAARNKPVLAIKAGRAPEGARAVASHTGALAGSDEVYDAAIRRAGMLRVGTVLELFDAVETLSRAKPVYGDRLAIMTNGGGPGVMATDALVRGGGRLASLSEQSLKRLDELLPGAWSHGNPVDIIGDAPVERYVATLETLLREPMADAVLFIHVPTAIVAAAEIARACAAPAKSGRVLGCWLGGGALDEARRIFADEGIPTYATPEEAVAGFLQLVDYRRNQQTLMETPSSAPKDSVSDTEVARDVVRAALGQGRELLSEPEAKRVLAAYGIPVVETRVAASAEEAAQLAQTLGFPVALKILSPQVTHKSDVGGVALDLASEAEVRGAAEAMARRLRERAPGAELAGFTVQKMVRRPRAHETIVGVASDPVFGPVILFGQGGVAVEVIADRAVALPPLNLALARELVSRTRIARLLDGYRDRPPADREALHLALDAGVAAHRRCSRGRGTRHQPAARRRQGRGGAGRPHSRGAGRDARRGSARDPALSPGAGGPGRLPRTRARAPAHPARGRAAARAVPRTDRPGRPAPALLHRRARLLALAARAVHADRLRPRDGVHRRRPRRGRGRGDVGCRARDRRPGPDPRGVRDPGPLRHERQGAG